MTQDPLLLTYLAELREIRIDHSLPDEMLTALADTHLSILQFIAANQPDNAYGVPEQHEAALEQLYTLCCHRCRSNQSLVRRSRLLPTRYALLWVPNRLTDFHRLAQCEHSMGRVIDVWLADKSSGEKNIRTAYGVLQCILSRAAQADETDMAQDEEIRYLQHQVQAWTAALKNDRWSDVSIYEALLRLSVMTRYAHLLPGQVCNTRIDQACSHYCNCALAETNGPDCTQLYRYWRLIRDIEYPGGHYTWLIAEQAKKQAACYPQGSQERFWHLAIGIHEACTRINEVIKQQILAHSA